jgi:hypothetical protein
MKPDDYYNERGQIFIDIQLDALVPTLLFLRERTWSRALVKRLLELGPDVWKKYAPESERHRFAELSVKDVLFVQEYEPKQFETWDLVRQCSKAKHPDAAAALDACDTCLCLWSVDHQYYGHEGLVFARILACALADAEEGVVVDAITGRVVQQEHYTDLRLDPAREVDFLMSEGSEPGTVTVRTVGTSKLGFPEIEVPDVPALLLSQARELMLAAIRTLIVKVHDMACEDVENEWYVESFGTFPMLSVAFHHWKTAVDGKVQHHSDSVDVALYSKAPTTTWPQVRFSHRSLRPRKEPKYGLLGDLAPFVWDSESHEYRGLLLMVEPTAEYSPLPNTDGLHWIENTHRRMTQVLAAIKAAEPKARG